MYSHDFFLLTFFSLQMLKYYLRVFYHKWVINVDLFCLSPDSRCGRFGRRRLKSKQLTWITKFYLNYFSFRDKSNYSFSDCWNYVGILFNPVSFFSIFYLDSLFLSWLGKVLLFIVWFWNLILKHVMVSMPVSVISLVKIIWSHWSATKRSTGILILLHMVRHLKRAYLSFLNLWYKSHITVVVQFLMRAV